MPKRRTRLDLAGASLALLALGACVPRAAPPSAPLPVVQVPAPRPLPPPQASSPPPSDWETGPASPGDWRYRTAMRNSSAIFRSETISFVIGCDGSATWLGVNGTHADALVIRTSFGMRRLPAVREGLNNMAARLPASDPLLAQMAFSRGRFLVTVEGGPSLVVPAWPEFARVVEDCRGQ
jgi:hypothetical protein